MKISESQYLAYIREKCENDFEFFVRYFFKTLHGTKFQFSEHHHLICQALMDVFYGRNTYLMVNMPPRYSKTELVVKMFSAWCYAKNPSCKFIHLSYSDSLAFDNSSAIKAVIQSEEFQQLWPLTLTSTATEAWKTEKGGAFIARPAGGQVTGYGAGKIDDFTNGKGFGGCILIDDPLKPDDAYSDVKRTAINRRWDETIKSRFNSKRTPCIVVMQRIHEDDFCGMLLNDPEYDFKQLVLPAIVDEGTDHEHALWPEKHSLEQLKVMREKNTYHFAGQYQQRPKPLGGGLIKGGWFGFYDVLPPLHYSAIYVDTAQKEKEANDYQVGFCWALGKDGYLYAVDLIRGKYQAYELEERMPAFWVKQKARPELRLRYMGIEDKASGTQLIQTIIRRVKPKIPVRAIERSRSKLERVMDVQGYIESGYVKLPRNAPWVSDFIDECEHFTPDDTHPHDDQIDCMCDAITDMLANRLPTYKDIV